MYSTPWTTYNGLSGRTLAQITKPAEIIMSGDGNCATVDQPTNLPSINGTAWPGNRRHSEMGNVAWKFSTPDLEFTITKYQAIDVYHNIKKMVKNWDDEHKAHVVSFNEVRNDPNKVRDFKEAQHAQDLPLEYAFGKDNATYRVLVDDIDLLPRTVDDARQWTYQLLLMRIGNQEGYHAIRSITDTLTRIIEEKPLRKRHPDLTVGWTYVEEKLRASTTKEDKNLLRSIMAAEDLTPLEDL
jgi:hypothetical protein